VSADSIVPSAGNPQALNRYAYVFNNPLKYVDPSGHEPGPNWWVERYENAHGNFWEDDCHGPRRGCWVEGERSFRDADIFVETAQEWLGSQPQPFTRQTLINWALYANQKDVKMAGMILAAFAVLGEDSTDDGGAAVMFVTRNRLGCNTGQIQNCSKWPRNAGNTGETAQYLTLAQVLTSNTCCQDGVNWFGQFQGLESWASDSKLYQRTPAKERIRLANWLKVSYQIFDRNAPDTTGGADSFQGKYPYADKCEKPNCAHIGAHDFWKANGAPLR
jgi:hypothetical protein